MAGTLFVAEGGHPGSINPGRFYALHQSRSLSGRTVAAMSHVICTAMRYAAESCGQDTMYISGLTTHSKGAFMHNAGCTSLDDS